jgi:hypothetical protein
MIFILRYKFVLFEKFVDYLVYSTFLSKKSVAKRGDRLRGGRRAGMGLWRKATARKYSLSRVPRFAN